MSKINVSTITNRTGTSGPVLSGVTTATNGFHVTSGSVGIGTDNPSSTGSNYGSLDISGSSGGEIFLSEDGTSKGNLFNYSADTNLVGLAAVNASGQLLFSTGGYIERLRITSAGNVGIGTTIPSDKLTVYKTNIGNPTGITIRNTETTSTYSHARLRLESQNGAAYGEIWADVANAGLRLGYNSSSTVKINTNGNIVLNNGSGIDFSATGQATGMTNELLDDYEEGNWTPTLTTTGTNFDAVAYQIQSGNYTKIGNLVTIRANFYTTSVTKGSASGNVIVTGLPFLPVDDLSGVCLHDIRLWDENPSTGASINTLGRIFFYRRTTFNGADTNLVVSDVRATNPGNLCQFFGQYYI